MMKLFAPQVQQPPQRVCLDQAGVYQGELAVVFTNIDDPPTLEALAIREALSLAEDLYVNRIFVASTARLWWKPSTGPARQTM